MSIYNLRVLEGAYSDLENSIIYYEEQLSGLGSEFEEEVYRLFKVIESNPLLFPVKFASFHEALVNRFPYMIVYEIVNDEIQVSSIFHCKQNPSKKLKRKKKG